MGLTASLAAGVAGAQTPGPTTAPAKPPPDKGAAASEVVVTGQRPAVVAAIDRTIYNVGEDPRAQTGTAADLLRNLPSVDVDLDGNPSLRGDANVQILLNGQPVPMLNGASRGAVLQSMGADAIDSIQVMTNPSAMFKPDGSAGIINIVTKKTYRPGPSGLVRVNAGTEGRYNLGANGALQAGETNLHLGYNFRADQRKRWSDTQRDDFDPALGQFTARSQSVMSEGTRFSQNLWAGADHDFGKADHVSLDLSWDERHSDPTSVERDLASNPVSDQTRRGTTASRGWDEDASVRWRHNFGAEGHDLTLHLDFSRNQSSDLNAYRYSYALPPGPDTAGDQSDQSREIQQQFSAEYVRPMPGGAKLQAGYSLQHDDNLYANGQDGVDPASGLRTPVAAQTNSFAFGQWIHALYGTYERPFGKLSVQGGLRLEQVQIDIDPQIGAAWVHSGYGRLYPSLHLNYALTGQTSLKLSYAQRASRPGPSDLNPFVVVQDAFNVSAGNPRLTPQVTHALELGLQDNPAAGASRSITLYWRQTENAISDVSVPISSTVLLNTKTNAGRLRSTGIDAFASGKPSKTLSYNLSAYLFYNEVRASNSWFSGVRNDLGYSGKLSLTWRPSGKDMLQWTGSYASRRLTGAGYREAGASADLGYRRQITDRLNLVLTVNDLFDSRGEKITANSPVAQDLYDRSQLGRTVLAGFSYRLGGGDQRRGQDERFNYGG